MHVERFMLRMCYHSSNYYCSSCTVVGTVNSNQISECSLTLVLCSLKCILLIKHDIFFKWKQQVIQNISKQNIVSFSYIQNKSQITPVQQL